MKNDAMPDCTPTELMTVVASRMLHNGETCFVGIGVPSAACNLARALHAPDLVMIYESGTVETHPTVLPLSIGDGELCNTALTTVSVPEMFGYWLQGGRITRGFLGTAQIDRYANLNTSVIGGTYAKPRVRLPGGGGAPEIAAHCKSTVIIVQHSKRTFVESLDFVTTMGYGSGTESRTLVGLHTAGPTHVVTDLCILEPAPQTKELMVTSLHPGVTVADVKAATGWPVAFAATVASTSPATVEELATLRDLNNRSANRNSKAVAGSGE